jgi:hypothetical protein
MYGLIFLDTKRIIRDGLMDELVSAEMDIAGRCKNTHKKIKKIFRGLEYFICQEELILSLPG